MNRLVGTLVAFVEELWLCVEQRPHLLQAAPPDRLRGRLAARRSVELRFERVDEHALHGGITAVARDLDRVIVDPQIQRVVVVIEKEPRDVNAILAHGEVERLPVVVMGARERAIFRNQRLHGPEVSRGARLEERPDIGTPAGGPGQLVVSLELRRLQHPSGRLPRFDVMDQHRPAVEAVLARQRVLRRRQGRRRIGGADRVEMFLGLLAELLQRRTVRQTTRGWYGHERSPFGYRPRPLDGLKEDRKL